MIQLAISHNSGKLQINKSLVFFHGITKELVPVVCLVVEDHNCAAKLVGVLVTPDCI
jgi:hypothetical protein